MTQNLKIRACFMQNFIELEMRRFLDPEAVIFGVWGPKTSLWQLGPINLEPWLQFSQTGTHFLQNHNMNPIKS